jgi:hypothetical protein
MCLGKLAEFKTERTLKEKANWGVSKVRNKGIKALQRNTSSYWTHGDTRYFWYQNIEKELQGRKKCSDIQYRKIHPFLTIERNYNTRYFITNTMDWLGYFNTRIHCELILSIHPCSIFAPKPTSVHPFSP